MILETCQDRIFIGHIVLVHMITKRNHLAPFNGSYNTHYATHALGVISWAHDYQ